MITEVDGLVEQYLAWLRDKTSLRSVDADWVEITTPYLDRHNDYLQMYARKTADGYVLTDGGYVIGDLRMSGCDLDTPKRQELLNMTVRGFGVQISGDALEVRVGSDDFSPRKHALVQAMLAVNDLFYLAVPMVRSLFLEDVGAWLDALGVRHTPEVKFTGRSGFDHVFHFVIPRSSRHPERVVQAVNAPTRQTASALAWSWVDTRDVRPAECVAYAILNDSETEVPPGVADALRSYDVRPVGWSARDSVVQELTG